MNDSNNIFSTDGEISTLPARSPLLPRIPSPSNIPSKSIRRRDSFTFRVDSSEEAPSSHASIFEALYTSPGASDENNNRIELSSLQVSDDSRPRLESPANDENSRVPEAQKTYQFDDVEFRYGHGTVLQTITEQKSSTTIRTLTKAKSVDDMLEFPFVRHRDSFVLSKSPRRKLSFSLDDLALTDSSYHAACAMIERGTPKPLFIGEIYAQPRAPVREPVERPPTPEGMPSWTAAQDIPRAARSTGQTATPTRLQRFFGIASSRNRSSTSASQPPQTYTRSVSVPITNGRLAPRFRPPRSAYGPMEHHPFNNAPVARIEHPALALDPPVATKKKRRLGLRVRFTPSATARDSEALALQAAIEASRTSAIHPNAPMQAAPIQHASVQVTSTTCPHRKARKPKSKRSHVDTTLSNTVPPSHEYVALSLSSPTRETPFEHSEEPIAGSPGRAISIASSNVYDSSMLHASNPRPTSVSSQTHLMSGALISPLPYPLGGSTMPPHLNASVRPKQFSSKMKTSRCWKCKIKGVREKIDQWWIQSAGCLCFVCCGFDVHDDMSYVGDGRSEGVPPYGATLRGGGNPNILGPRRIVLQAAPTARR